MKRKSIIIYLMMCWCVAPLLHAQTRHAFLVGLSTMKDKSWAGIHGANDVLLMKKLLGEASFTDIVTLSNRQATKAGIVRELERLTQRCQKGDVVYIHYSGHGQMMTDLDGDEQLRHPGARHSQWDESWVPYDACMEYGEGDRGERHLSDDEVASYLTLLRGRVGEEGRIYVAIDACHSGFSTNGHAEEPVRGVDKEFIVPLLPRPQQPTLLPEQWMTISACQAYQLCFEMRKPAVGKLTAALYKIGKQFLELEPEELQRRLQHYMDAHPSRLPQNPLVTGRPDGKIEKK